MYHRNHIESYTIIETICYRMILYNIIEWYVFSQVPTGLYDTIKYCTNCIV